MSRPLVNSADPTTRTSTPSAPTTSAVSRLTPPSTWTSPPYGLVVEQVAGRAGASRWRTSCMNAWPPNPGSTVMTITMSSSSRYGSSATSGVAGLDRQPGRPPGGADRSSVGAMRLVDLDVERDRVAAGVEELVDVAARLADHQVGVERQLRAPAGGP